MWTEPDDGRGVTLYGHFGSRGDFAAVAYFDPVRERSIIGFANEDADVEELMWAAWDWAETRGS